MTRIDFYIPKTKRELVDWFKRNCPGRNWNKMAKKQLLAIYINTRKRDG